MENTNTVSIPLVDVLSTMLGKRIVMSGEDYVDFDSLTKVSEERMKLRVEYSRETDLIFIDNIPAYADWLEKKLALHQQPVGGELNCEQLCDFLEWYDEDLTLEEREMNIKTYMDMKSHN